MYYSKILRFRQANAFLSDAIFKGLSSGQPEITVRIHKNSSSGDQAFLPHPTVNHSPREQSKIALAFSCLVSVLNLGFK
jgi:hypothetical protein